MTLDPKDNNEDIIDAIVRLFHGSEYDRLTLKEQFIADTLIGQERLSLNQENHRLYAVDLDAWLKELQKLVERSLQATPDSPIGDPLAHRLVRLIDIMNGTTSASRERQERFNTGTKDQRAQAILECLVKGY